MLCQKNKIMKKLSNVSPFILLVLPVIVIMLATIFTNHPKNTDKQLNANQNTTEQSMVKTNVNILR